MSEITNKPNRQYTKEYKVEAVKLVREIGTSKAAKELGIPTSTISQWVGNANIGRIDTGLGSQTPGTAMTQAQEIQYLRAENKKMAKEITRIKEINEFLEEASAFFAASRQRLAKKRE